MWQKLFPVTARGDQSNYLNSGTFFYVSGAPGCRPPFMDTNGNSGRLGRSAYAFKERNNVNSLHKINMPSDVITASNNISDDTSA